MICWRGVGRSRCDSSGAFIYVRWTLAMRNPYEYEAFSHHIIMDKVAFHVTSIVNLLSDNYRFGCLM
jgi:hypothetical protein